MKTRPPQGFVALSALRQGAPSTEQALAEIRRIYFATTAKTIDHDFAHAIELLKGLENEAAREKASVFMEGLAELLKEWQPRDRAPRKRPKRTKHQAPRT
jgi:hypothetical protein